MKPVFGKNRRSLEQAQSKQLYKKNLESIIEANTSIDILLGMLINQFADQFNSVEPRIVPELQKAKQHMQNMNFLFSRM